MDINKSDIHNNDMNVDRFHITGNSLCKVLLFSTYLYKNNGLYDQMNSATHLLITSNSQEADFYLKAASIATVDTKFGFPVLNDTVCSLENRKYLMKQQKGIFESYHWLLLVFVGW